MSFSCRPLQNDLCVSAHHVRPQGTNLQENYSNPQSSLHPSHITFFPLLGNIHLSLDYESPQNFLASPPEPKKIPIILLTCSLPLSDFIIVFFPTVYCFLCLFLCLLSTIIVQPLAITFNKRYEWTKKSVRSLTHITSSDQTCNHNTND